MLEAALREATFRNAGYRLFEQGLTTRILLKYIYQCIWKQSRFGFYRI